MKINNTIKAGRLNKPFKAGKSKKFCQRETGKDAVEINNTENTDILFPSMEKLRDAAHKTSEIHPPVTSPDIKEIKDSVDRVSQRFETRSSLHMNDYMIPSNKGRIKHMALTYGMLEYFRVNNESLEKLKSKLPGDKFASIEKLKGSFSREVLALKLKELAFSKDDIALVMESTGKEDNKFRKDNYLEVMKTLISKMPSARFTILTADKEGQKELEGYVDRWSKDNTIENPDRVNIVSSDREISIWAQDSTVVIGNKVVEPKRFSGKNMGDRCLAEYIAKDSPGLDHEKMGNLIVDGGNQLATEDTLFVGSDVVFMHMPFDMEKCSEKYTTAMEDPDIKRASKVSKQELAKMMVGKVFPHQKLVVVGHTVGIKITNKTLEKMKEGLSDKKYDLLTRYKDTFLLRNVIEPLMKEFDFTEEEIEEVLHLCEPQKMQPAFHIDMFMTPFDRKTEEGKPVIALGDPGMAADILKDIKAKDPKKFEGYEKSLREKIPELKERALENYISSDKEGEFAKFDSVAQEFSEQGYKVERVPFLSMHKLWMTYNNSVVDGDNVFVPNFGIKELDDKANEVYKKYDYNPIPLDMRAICSMQGAINCMTKVVERVYEEALPEGKK